MHYTHKEQEDFNEAIVSDEDTLKDYLTNPGDDVKYNLLLDYLNNPSVTNETKTNIINTLTKIGFYNYIYDRFVKKPIPLHLYACLSLMDKSISIIRHSFVYEHAELIININRMIKKMLDDDICISDDMQRTFLYMVSTVFFHYKNYNLIQESNILEEICFELSDNNFDYYCNIVHAVFTLDYAIDYDYKNKTLVAIMDKIISFKNKDLKDHDTVLLPYCEMLTSMLMLDYDYTMYKLIKNNGMTELQDFADKHLNTFDEYYQNANRIRRFFIAIYDNDDNVFPNDNFYAYTMNRLESSIYFGYNDIFEELIYDQSEDKGRGIIIALRLCKATGYDETYLKMAKKLIYMGGRITEEDIKMNLEDQAIRYYHEYIEQTEIISKYKKQYIEHFINIDAECKKAYESGIENIINSYINVSLFV